MSKNCVTRSWLGNTYAVRCRATKHVKLVSKYARGGNENENGAREGEVIGAGSGSNAASAAHGRLRTGP